MSKALLIAAVALAFGLGAADALKSGALDLFDQRHAIIMDLEG